jgi:hypothetical protein
MAYFRCSTGSASSGDGVALVVTCDQNFAGAVITTTNGTDTFAETCPSASPYTVRFEDIPVGTYTISGVAQGQTFTTQYTVLDYSTGLYSAPTGATVTPVNVIQTWLHCANIWDKTYTKISQVLADASTLQALIASNNAADYMARSTNWASSVTANANAMTYIGANNYCANKLLSNSTWLNAICNSTYMESVLNVKVPTMTSNTTPYGEASANKTIYGSGNAYKAFNNDSTQSGSCTLVYNASMSDGRVHYKFTSAKKILMAIYKTFSTSDNSRVKSARIVYSDDGTTWENASEVITFSASQTQIPINISEPHLYWGIGNIINGGNSGNVFVSELQFYGRA